MNYGFGLRQIAEKPMGNVRDAALGVAQKLVGLGNKELQKVLQDAGGLVIRHNPYAKTGVKSSRRRVNYSPALVWLSRHKVTEPADPIADRLPATAQVRVSVDNYANNIPVLVARPELDGNVFKERSYTTEVLYTPQLNSALLTEVLQDAYVVPAFHQK